MAHFILQLRGVLRLEAFYSKYLFDSLQLQLVIRVMVVGADIGHGNCGQIDVAGSSFPEGFLYLLL